MSLHVFEGTPPDLGDIPPLTHGPTGSRVVRGSIDINRAVSEYHYLEPGPPSRRVSTWDEDDIEHERVLTDEEFAQAQANYEKRHAEWARTCGTVQVAGQTTVTMKGTCKDGSSFEAMIDGATNEWRFTAWDTWDTSPISRAAVKAE